MDRLARLPWWPWPLLLGLALVTAAWLTLGMVGDVGRTGPLPASDCPRAGAAPASRSEASEAQASRPDAAVPRLLPAGQPARWLPPLGADSRSVMAAEYLAAENQGAAGFPWLDEKDLPAGPGGSRDRTIPRGTLRPPHGAVVRPPEKLPVASAAPQAKPAELASAQPGRTPVAAVLSPPTAAKERSPQLEHIARQADGHTREGFALAGRGACFAARAQFVKALGLVAEGLDAELQTHAHGRSLRAGLTALREADDFPPAGSASGTRADLARIVAGHRTPVLKDLNPAGLTPLAATQCYLGFAQEQLAAAAGEELAGSMALYALGKLHATLAARGSREIPGAAPKAVTFFQAALLVYPRNHLASNDLGVLLAQGGHYRDAYRSLAHSLSIHPQSTGWHNLAVVLSHLGDDERSRRAEHLAALARQQEAARRQTGSASGLVQWIDPGSFARTSTEGGGPGPAAPVAAGVPRHTAAPPARGPAAATPAASPGPQPAAPSPPRVVRQPADESGRSATGWRWPWQRDRQTQ